MTPLRQRIRAQHRELTDVWVELLGEIHPGLPVADRVTVVDSAMWLLRCPAFFRSELPDERVAQLLTTMIMGSLLIEQLDDRRGTIRRRVRQLGGTSATTPVAHSRSTSSRLKPRSASTASLSAPSPGAPTTS